MGPLLIPLALQFAPFLISEVTTLIQHLHKTVPPSPQNDAKKLSTVVEAQIPILQGLVDTGVIPAMPANGAELTGVLSAFVQGVFNQLKASNSLPARPGDPPKPTSIFEGTPDTSSISSKGFEIPISFTGKLTLSI